MSRFLGQVLGTSRSRGILASLARVEAPAVMDPTSSFPVVLRKAVGARVQDVDGNRYIDLTGFFGVALVGHRNRAVTQALRTQAGRLVHGMGDVHPSERKAAFLAAIAARMPAPDYRGLLSLNGADAVDCALKFAAAATGRAGFVAFEGAYHGLSTGALEATHNPIFRTPFVPVLTDRATFLPFPAADGSDSERVLSAAVNAFATGRIGAVLFEPIQGRGGFRVPPPGFLAALCDAASRAGVATIADEIYTGCGRTGAFLAGTREGVVPDVVCLGKALGGGVPLSVCMMRPNVADAVRSAGPEAVHTSTFLGNPLACAAGLAVLGELDRLDFASLAARIGSRVRARAEVWRERFPVVSDVRGAGAMIGVELGRGATRVVEKALSRGVVLLTEGPEGNVLAFTPPLVIPATDLARALGIVEDCIAEVAS